MPRPQHNPGASFSPQSEKIPIFKKFSMKRRERKLKKEEQLAKAVTNSRAEMETNMINALERINFVRSKLPPEYLDHKSIKEGQKVGDLEYTALQIAEQIKRSPNYTIDISEIDKRLIMLIKEFSDAVADGYVRAAYAAKGALTTCIMKVRERIPNINADLQKNFVESSVKYLDTWLSLVYFSREADEIEENVKNENTNYEQRRTEFDESIDELHNKLDSSPAYLQAFSELYERTATEDMSKWSTAMREVRKMLTDQKIAFVSMQLTERMLNSQEMKLQDSKRKIDTLEAKVVMLPIPEDPNALNKYNEEVEGIFAELARIDAETDEMVSSLEDMEGRIEMLDNAPGAIHIRNAIADQAEKMLEEISFRQNSEVPSSNISYRDFLRSHGIRTKEEQEEFIRQNQRVVTEEKAEETESSLLYEDM